jgi:hypothetical protein
MICLFAYFVFFPILDVSVNINMAVFLVFVHGVACNLFSQ